MTELSPISPSDEICKVLPCLPEKFIVDFANGIDVVNDHLRVQRARNGFSARLYDGFTGQGQRRQAEINASLVDSVEASLQWLTELSRSLARSNLAMTHVKNRVAMIQTALIDLTHYSADTRQQIERLSFELNERCTQLERDIKRIDLVQRANIEIDLVFSKWEAGKFASFSLAGRCYAVLEELRWGAFGDLYRNGSIGERATHLEILSNRAISQLMRDTDEASTKRLDTTQWLAPPHGRDLLPDAQDALAYLGDWSCIIQSPFVHAICNCGHKLPLRMPRICSSERLVEGLVSDIFRVNE
ncbi:hypothetical protein HW932_02685 [Allochromatium humboldtianum]|uniref:Uncharacterized protein n=1 Tax=Allochromatium humboldtianum TaxID=504901 RepID=A0A850R3D9_9GAMM|nr:diguanylate cyclase regulator RdcB family protein [Allochromatium humboldtianum]NVZ08164.1 hypothetical protein [Allochromatium humboldtianum]